MKVQIAMVTGRAEPHLDWLLESLAPQVAPDDVIDVLVIDMRGRTPEQLGALPRYGHWEPTVRVEHPMPSPWQGPHRITTTDWWSKSSAANTALVLCESDYVAFVDDSCHVGPKWLDTVRRGERERYSVLAGSYDKYESGIVTQDGRRAIAPDGRHACGGGWLYGCTFALPLEWALDVNGFEHGCDGMGGEDYIFGLMLETAGHRVDFVPELLVVQQRPEVSGPGGHALRRTDKGASPNDKSHAALDRFRVRRRTEFTPDLRALRGERLITGSVTWPMTDPDMRDWYDGSLVREMV